MSVLNVQATTEDRAPRVKRAPELPLVHIYNPSDDGTDENLLILLHGLGELTLFPRLGD